LAVSVLVAAAATAAWAQGATGSVVSAGSTCALQADGGFDFRARQENLNNIPYVNGRGPGLHQDYLRVRERVWGSLGTDDLSVYTRLANEWRSYWAPGHLVKNCNWPDETLVDSLYLDVKNLFADRVDLRIGRQDLMYGAGRVIMDGTPGDGSRTFFLDAVRATIRLDPANTIDLLGIRNGPHTDLATGSKDHDLTQIWGRQYLGMKGNNLTETGAGAVWKNRSDKDIPFEAYALWKNESGWRKWDTTYTAYTPMHGRNVYTLGLRTTPRLGDELTGDFEGAAQFGRTDDGQDIFAGMGYAGVTWQPKVQTSWQPYLKPACYYMSGDKNPDDGTVNAWDPLWARYPQFSELYVLAYNAQYGVGYWSNLVYPDLEAGVTFAPQHKFCIYSGPMLAAVKDVSADSRLRGWLSVARYDFPIRTPGKGGGDILSRRLAVYGHLLAEVLTPGEYYQEQSMAYFLRWEINVKF
jgi:hypothetical protein